MELNVGGTRRLHKGALRAREYVVERERGVGRKELMAVARDCAEGLRLRASVRMVLCELAACYGEQALERGLMVWPSNEHVSRRTGLVERTIRKCVSELVRLAVLEPVDSANRKRFAVRAENGDVLDAFGFNLAPLYARRQEWTALLMQQRVEREARSRLFDEVTMNRKAVEEALRGASTLGVDVAAAVHDLVNLIRRTPRRGHGGLLEPLLVSWRALRTRAEEAFNLGSDSHTDSGYVGVSCRHIETNKNPSTESCKADIRNERAAKPGHVPSVPLLVEACPAIKDYDRNIGRVEDITRLGRYLRASIGAHPDAWAEAEEALGAPMAASLVIYVLQLTADDGSSGHSRIRNPGGLYRDLVRRASGGTFNLTDELTRLKRKRMQ